MAFVVFVLGVVAAAAGVLMIGFGIPINEFSLGNTLIIAGTTALAGGLIVIALAVVARQVTKVADLLQRRPAGSASGRSSDMHDQAAGGDRMPVPRPAFPAEAAQPRVPGTAAGFDPVDEMPPPAPAPRPRVPGPGSPPPPPPAAPDAKAAPRGWRPPGMRQPPPDPIRHEPSIAAPERPQPPAQEPSFDAIWPPPERRAERVDPKHDAPAEPPPAASPRFNGDAIHREPPARPTVEKAPVSVLKSGVVDGMAYTLYTDGSIEAELAQGVVRFGSIEELRNHLEKGA